MLETPHVIVGAAIASKVANPALSLPLAFASHFLLEKVPHWNPHLNTEKRKFGRVTAATTKIVIIDASLSLLTGLYIASLKLPDLNQFLIVVFACFLSALPDIIEGPYFFLNVRSKLIEKWVALQKAIQSDTEVIPGLATQLVTVSAAIWWLAS